MYRSQAKYCPSEVIRGNETSMKHLQEQKSSQKGASVWTLYDRVGRGMSTAQNRVFEAPSNLPNKVELPPQNDYFSTENERTFALSEEAQF